MTHATTRSARARLRSAWARLPLIAAGMALCAWSLADGSRVQGAEVSAGAVLLRDVFGAAIFADPVHDLLYVRSASFGWVPFHVAPSCSTALLLPGLCLVTAVLLALRPIPALAPPAGLLAAAAVFGSCNLARITMIVLVGRQWGTGAAFDLAHVWAGTAVTICGVTAAVAAYLYALGAGRGRMCGGLRDLGTPAVPEQGGAHGQASV